ncbi:hypothetical protein KDM41_04690, partial [bacterium]|nr:hypothetical protein [bacterium]
MTAAAAPSLDLVVIGAGRTAAAAALAAARDGWAVILATGSPQGLRPGARHVGEVLDLPDAATAGWESL